MCICIYIISLCLLRISFTTPPDDPLSLGNSRPRQCAENACLVQKWKRLVSHGSRCKTGCVWAQVSPKKHSKFSLEKRFSHRLEWGSPLSNPQHVGGLSQWYPMNSRVNSMYPHTRFPRLANGSGIRLPTGSLADGILVWNWKKHGVQGIFQDCWMTSSDSAGNLNDSNRD